uniref:Uncharacterized protein n=1 Tax=Pseudomonas phage Touem01 TaxID=3138548 RepID=A0AAU6W1Z6_9VIRU
MKRIALAFILCASFGTAAADSSSCYTINDADARSYCLAKTRHDTSACYTIQRADLRSMCLAEIQH